MERSTSGSGSSIPDTSNQQQQRWMENTSPDDDDGYEDDDIDEDEDEDVDDDGFTHDGGSNDDDYFSNESDILDDDTFNNVDEENIFDVDFPHEQDALIHHHSTNTNTYTASPPQKLPPPIQTPNTNRYSSSSNNSSSRPNSMTFHQNNQESNTSARPLSLQMKRSSSTLPRSFSMYSPTATRNSMESDSSSTYSAPPPVQQQQQQRQYVSPPPPLPIPSHHRISQQQDASLSLLSGVPSFSYDKMDEFVKFHRAEIREITECAKRETKLVANISLDLSSNQEFGSTSADTKSQTQFSKYLEDLDEILTRKLAAVEALRDRISETVGQIEL